MDLFRYVKPNRRHIVDINETIATVLKKGDNFSAMSTLALRAAALFSHERVLCISAQVALEQATRAGKIWEHPHPVDREAGGTGQRLIAKGAGDDLSRVIAHPERDRLEITILVEAA